MSDLVVKDNALISASYTLDLIEQRLMLLAITQARETGLGITENSLLEVHAAAYINCFGVDKSTAYRALKEASKGLFDRYVTYHDKNPKNGRDRSFHCRWVDKIGYEEQSGLVYLRFTQDVVPLITRLEENFTRYELHQIAKLSSTYAIRMYELLIRWRSIGQTPVMEIQEFRNQLGVRPNDYKLMSDFKKRVLDLSVKLINDFTDISVEYIQHKKGRSIIGFSFKFRHKQNQAVENLVKSSSKQTNILDRFHKLTDKQLDMFSSKLAELPAVQAMAHVGEDMKPFVARLRKMLMDYEQQKVLQPYLQEMGYVLH